VVDVCEHNTEISGPIKKGEEQLLTSLEGICCQDDTSALNCLLTLILLAFLSF
jgi:hypothetical protein